MSKIKHLGKFLDDGDYIELPFNLDEGKYRVEIKPSGESKRDKTVYISDDGKMRLPNFNGKKAFALGSNIFKISKAVDGKPQRVTIETYARWSLFLKANTGTTFDEVDYKSLLDGLDKRVKALEQIINGQWYKQQPTATGKGDEFTLNYSIDEIDISSFTLYYNGQPVHVDNYTLLQPNILKTLFGFEIDDGDILTVDYQLIQNKNQTLLEIDSGSSDETDTNFDGSIII